MRTTIPRRHLGWDGDVQYKTIIHCDQCHLKHGDSGNGRINVPVLCLTHVRTATMNSFCIMYSSLSTVFNYCIIE